MKPFLGSMREVTIIQVTTKLFKDRFGDPDANSGW
jgi:hypothetical protein